nr:M90 family metallopeptidase [Flocculibacter collagenilyticus]
MQLLIILAIGMVILGWIFGKPYWQAYQRHKIKQQAFPKAWREIIKRRFPYFKKMPADLQLQLKKHVQVFIAEKTFVGGANLNITDEIKVTIALQACLLLLNRKTNYYPKLERIVVYPGAFAKTQRELDHAGLETERRTVMLGESWQLGKVILSWQDTVAGAEDPCDGSNVVIHEFAHQLDQESGHANGAPLLPSSINYQQWSDALDQAFKQLKYQQATGQASLFDYYGATNPAEFFAVASEVFFEQTQDFARHYPHMYQLFCRYYAVDPLHWH